MKRFMMVVVIGLGLAACGEETKTKCSATCLGKLSVTNCSEYNSQQYTGGTISCNTSTCQLDFSACQTQAKVTEGGLCTGTGAGDCDTGLTCSDNALFGAKLCVRACDDNTSACTTDEYCESVLKGAGVAENAFCWPKAERNDTCLSSDGCDTTMMCSSPVSDGITTECMLACDGGTVGTTGSCGSEKCLAGPGVEPQGGLDNPLACANVGTTDNCDGAKKYTCLNVSFGQNDTRKVCARSVGVCGKEAEYLTTFTEDIGTGSNRTLGTIGDAVNRGFVHTGVTTAAPTLCDLPGNNVFCGELGGTFAGTLPNKAKLECADTRQLLYPIDQDTQEPYGCTKDPDCFGLASKCFTAGDGQTTVQICADAAKLCFPYCESGDGKTAWECPNGTTCQNPSVKDPTLKIGRVGDPILQMNGTTPVTCTNAGTTDTCDGINRFTCVGFSDGKFCVRFRKVCALP